MTPHFTLRKSPHRCTPVPCYLSGRAVLPVGPFLSVRAQMSTVNFRIQEPRREPVSKQGGRSRKATQQHNLPLMWSHKHGMESRQASKSGKDSQPEIQEAKVEQPRTELYRAHSFRLFAHCQRACMELLLTPMTSNVGCQELNLDGLVLVGGARPESRTSKVSKHLPRRSEKAFDVCSASPSRHEHGCCLPGRVLQDQQGQSVLLVMPSFWKHACPTLIKKIKACATGENSCGRSSLRHRGQHGERIRGGAWRPAYACHIAAYKETCNILQRL